MFIATSIMSFDKDAKLNRKPVPAEKATLLIQEGKALYIGPNAIQFPESMFPKNHAIWSDRKLKEIIRICGPFQPERPLTGRYADEITYLLLSLNGAALAPVGYAVHDLMISEAAAGAMPRFRPKPRTGRRSRSGRPIKYVMSRRQTRRWRTERYWPGLNKKFPCRLTCGELAEWLGKPVPAEKMLAATMDHFSTRSPVRFSRPDVLSRD